MGFESSTGLHGGTGDGFDAIRHFTRRNKTVYRNKAHSEKVPQQVLFFFFLLSPYHNIAMVMEYRIAN